MAQDIRVGRIILVIALVIALRVLAVSLILPVFSPYGLTLTDSVLLVGIALGGYGLTMAIMQIPMGIMSDRWGRRPLLLAGLSVFVIGSVVAGLAEPIGEMVGVDAIWILIVGRLVEGVGAVSSVGTALLTDVVPEERRTFALAIAGIGAGTAFLVGVSIGPVLEPLIGVPGLFLLAAALGAVLLISLVFVIPSGLKPEHSEEVGLRSVFFDKRALRLNVAGFAMNFTLIATMFALPLVAADSMGAETYRWTLIVMVLVGGVLAIGASRGADKAGRVRMFSAVSALLIGLGAAALLTFDMLWLYILVGVLYFGGHAGQSASLPSLIGALFPGNRRGAAMGALNTWLYFGSFVGGTVAALLFEVDALLPLILAGLGLVVSVTVLTIGRVPSRKAARTP